MGAISRWLSTTIVAAAATPAIAYETRLVLPRASSTTWKAAQAAIIENVQLAMLKIAMYQGSRVFSHSGSGWSRPRSATRPGGKSIAAGIRKTIVVWYAWWRGVPTTKSCAVAEISARIANVVQPCVPVFKWLSGGAVAAIVAAITTKK